MGKDDFPKHVSKSQGQLCLRLTPLKPLGSEPLILLSCTSSPSAAHSLLQHINNKHFCCFCNSSWWLSRRGDCGQAEHSPSAVGSLSPGLSRTRAKRVKWAPTLDFHANRVTGIEPPGKRLVPPAVPRLWHPAIPSSWHYPRQGWCCGLWLLLPDYWGMALCQNSAPETPAHPLQRAVIDWQQGMYTINCEKSNYFAYFWQFCELKWRQNTVNVFGTAVSWPCWDEAGPGQGRDCPWLCVEENPLDFRLRVRTTARFIFFLVFWGSYNKFKCVRVYTILPGLAGLWAWLLALCFLYCLWLCIYFN